MLELRLAKAGQPGPKLVSHAIDKPGSMIVLGSRDVTMDVLADALSSISLGLGRTLVDKTGLKGRFDFTLEWTREPRGSAVSDSPAPVAPAGLTIIEALHDQLGLKLEPAKASLPILVIDRVERPSAN